MVWSAFGQLGGVEFFGSRDQRTRSTPCDLTAVQEKLQADATDINAIGLMSRFADDPNATSQRLVLVSAFPVDSRSDPPKGVR